MDANTTTFVGELRKDRTIYYFEIRANGTAYIEKDEPTPKYEMRRDKNYGTFTIEYARRCWKALKAKGFREYDSDEGKYLESATK